MLSRTTLSFSTSTTSRPEKRACSVSLSERTAVSALGSSMENVVPTPITTRVALLSFVLAAAHAGAGTTITVPLEFTMDVQEPVCSLTVGGATADAGTPSHASGVLVNLTPMPLSVLSSPNGIVNSLPGTSAIAASAPGLLSGAPFPGNRKLDAPPAAFVTCSAGTPMIARITRTSAATHASPGVNFLAGAAGSGQSGTLPVGMLMGIQSFAGVAGATGASGTTYGSAQPSVSATSNGVAQSLVLTAAIYGNSSTPLSATQAGLWTYSFNINLDF